MQDGLEANKLLRVMGPTVSSNKDKSRPQQIGLTRTKQVELKPNQFWKLLGRILSEWMSSLGLSDCDEIWYGSRSMDEEYDAESV